MRSHEQPVHVVLHLCYAHVLVRVCVRYDATLPQTQSKSEGYGYQVPHLLRSCILCFRCARSSFDCVRPVRVYFKFPGIYIRVGVQEYARPLRHADRYAVCLFPPEHRSLVASHEYDDEPAQQTYVRCMYGVISGGQLRMVRECVRVG